MADLLPTAEIIKRYYDHQDIIQQQRLAELVSELYLAEARNGKRSGKRSARPMQKLGVPQSRIDHLVEQENPALVAEVVKNSRPDVR